jgi:inhibitor of cysteine peptidase
MRRPTARNRLVRLVLLSPLFLFVTPGKALLLDDSDNNSHLCLYVGDALTIKLASNPTTGYSWGQPEVSHLQIISTDSERGSSKRVGDPGFQTFSLKATEAGESTLTLTYLRPSEKDKPPAQTFLLFLTIEERPFVTKDSSAKP